MIFGLQAYRPQNKNFDEYSVILRLFFDGVIYSNHKTSIYLGIKSQQKYQLAFLCFMQ